MRVYGGWEVRRDAESETRFHFSRGITSALPWLVVSDSTSGAVVADPRPGRCFAQRASIRFAGVPRLGLGDHEGVAGLRELGCQQALCACAWASAPHLGFMPQRGSAPTDTRAAEIDDRGCGAKQVPGHARVETRVARCGGMRDCVGCVTACVGKWVGSWAAGGWLFHGPSRRGPPRGGTALVWPERCGSVSPRGGPPGLGDRSSFEIRAQRDGSGAPVDQVSRLGGNVARPVVGLASLG